jgi:hypothetical protein
MVLTFFEYASGKFRLLSASTAVTPGIPVTGDVDFNDKVLSKATIKDYAETKVTTASSGTTLSVSLADGNVREITLDNTCQLTLTNPPASGTCGSVTLVIKQDATGGRELTFMNTIIWSGGMMPELSTDAEAIDVLTLFTYDGGTTWLGFEAGVAMATGTEYTGIRGIINYEEDADQYAMEYSNGFIENGGSVSVPANSGVAVTFLIPFTATPKNTIAGANQITTNGTDLSGVGCDNISTTAMRVYNESTITKTVSWLAKGK